VHFHFIFNLLGFFLTININIHHLFMCESTGKLLRWLGITLQMGTFNLKNRAMYWNKRPGGVDFGFSEVMTLRTWETIWRHLQSIDPPPVEGENVQAPVPTENVLASQEVQP
jgi:hypothetical protein